MRMFEDRVGVVTGAGSGVGKAIALELASLGTTVYLVGRREEALEAVAREARASGVRVACAAADLTDDAAIRRLASYVEAEAGQVDLLVHSAGVIALGDLQSADVDDLDLQYRTNVRAPYLLTQALLPMLTRQRGQIVFVNSSAGLSARAGLGQYAATKHALKAIADSVRCEVNQHGVRVLSVFLGRTATPMQRSVHELEGKPYRPGDLIQPEDVAATVIHALSLPPTVEITDISLRPMKKPG
jgi:NADP-dependent 3-hydroxy acid dehydrogenase YdfG